MANLNNFRFNTDYPQDMICFFYEGMPNWEFGGHVAQAYLNNNLGFNPLIFGVWCETADFSSPKQLNTISPLDYSTGLPVQDDIFVECSEWGNDRVIRLLLTAASGTAQPVYVRVYGFVPTDISPDVLSTSSNANKIIFNSDYTYRKLLMAGVQNITSSSSVVINHNLGYRPQVMAWGENINTQYQNKALFNVAASELASNNTAEHKITVNNSSLIFSFKNIVTTSTSSWRVHYRIYADEA